MKITCCQCGEQFEDVHGDGNYQCLTLICYVRNAKRQRVLDEAAARRKAKIEQILEMIRQENEENDLLMGDFSFRK